LIDERAAEIWRTGMIKTRSRCSVITGANRGLGLEFVRQLVARGDFVVGTCRVPDGALELRELLADGKGLILSLEVSDRSAAEAAASEVGGLQDTVDLLINAAGVEDSAGSSGPLGYLESDALVAIYVTNAVGPALVTQAFAGLLARSDQAIVLNLTSSRGAIDSAIASGKIGYAMSKASLNMLTRKLALELHRDGTAVVALSPGWVQTDMGGPDAPLTASESVRSMLALTDRLTLADTGAVLDHDAVLAGAEKR
jgi:NAD(P)-dependent dehydrogenase (short-subunit alcohol dehydrogenase family)